MTAARKAVRQCREGRENINKMILGQMMKQTVIDLKVAVRALTKERDQLWMDVARLRTVTRCIL